jgi:hypothetical protein
MKLVKKLADRALDRMVGKGSASAGTHIVACRCVYNPAICTGGHERLCDGAFAGCC